jgi:hypothetical protein
VLGLTDPFVELTDKRMRNMQNRIPMIIAGARIKHGDYSEGKGVTHVNILRTLEPCTACRAVQKSAAIRGRPGRAARITLSRTYLKM